MSSHEQERELEQLTILYLRYRNASTAEEKQKLAEEQGVSVQTLCSRMARYDAVLKEHYPSAAAKLEQGVARYEKAAAAERRRNERRSAAKAKRDKALAEAKESRDQLFGLVKMLDPRQQVALTGMMAVMMTLTLIPEMVALLGLIALCAGNPIGGAVVLFAVYPLMRAMRKKTLARREA